MSDNQVSIRCVVVGDNGVGKSTLIQSYVNNKFIENLEERTHFRCKENIDNQNILLCITDMPIVEKLRSELYVGVDVCILCYNIANEKSLENIETKWVLEVKDYCPERPYILVGTKGDLCGELKRRENIILETEGNELAQKISASNHIICSSMKMENVSRVFETAIRVALIDADLNKNHKKSFSWTIPVEYVGSIINKSMHMAKCAVPLLKQTAINVRESWSNPNAFVEAKHNLLYYAPFLSPCVPVTKARRNSHWYDAESRTKNGVDHQHEADSKGKSSNSSQTTGLLDAGQMSDDITQYEGDSLRCVNMLPCIQ